MHIFRSIYQDYKSHIYNNIYKPYFTDEFYKDHTLSSNDKYIWQFNKDTDLSSWNFLTDKDLGGNSEASLSIEKDLDTNEYKLVFQGILKAYNIKDDPLHKNEPKIIKKIKK